MQHETELTHLPVCICTKNVITGYVLDYDCGRALDEIAALERELEHRRAIAAASIGQTDRAECVADRELAQRRLERARRYAGLT